MSLRATLPLSAALLATLLTFGANTLAAQAGVTDLPVYPGAVASARPAGVGLKRPPPPQAKTYATNDSFAKVKAWYQGHLTGAQEAQEAGMEKFEDAFLVGNFGSGSAIFIESYKGKTWIIIGPAA